MEPAETSVAGIIKTTITLIKTTFKNSIFVKYKMYIKYTTLTST